MSAKSRFLSRLRRRWRRTRKAVRRAPFVAVKGALRIGPVRQVVGRFLAPQMALIAAKLVKESQRWDPTISMPQHIPAMLSLQLAHGWEDAGDVVHSGAATNGTVSDDGVTELTSDVTSPVLSPAPLNGLSMLPADRITGVIHELNALDRSLRADEYLIVGPWLGEVGFEILYWIPHLNWVAATYPRLASRMVVVSRGGVASWYSTVVPRERYIDLFELISAEEFQKWTEQRHDEGLGQKQTHATKFERRLIEQAKQRLGVANAKLLHPRRLYDAFRQLRYFDAIPQLRRISAYRPFGALGRGPLTGRLPDDYIAVRFYFNNSFPDTPENRRFIASLLRDLSAQNTVVLLNPRMKLDDHHDFEEAASGRIIRIDEAMTPSTNLEMQTHAIRGARAFVGTYGGLSYLAPHLGVPALSFYSEPSLFNPQHLELAQRLFRGPEWGQYVALDVTHAELVRWSFPPASGDRPAEINRRQ